MKLLVN